MKKLLFFFGSVILLSCHKTTGSDQDPVPAADSAQIVVVPTREYNSSSALVNALTAFNMNGSVKWKRTDLGSSSDPYLTYDNGVFFMSVTYFAFIGGGPSFISYNNLYAINATTGNNVWAITNSQDYIYTPVARKDTLYCSIVNGSVYSVGAYSASTGSLLWKKPISFPYPANNLHVDGNTLYFVTATSSTVNNVIAFDLSTKTIKWNNPIGVNFANVYSKIVIVNNSLLIKNGTGALLCFDKNTGQTLWSKTNISYEQPVYANNMVYNTNGSGLFALDVQTGNPLWQWNTGNWWIGGNPYVSGANVFISGAQNNNFISCFNAANGSLVWRQDRNDILQYPVVVADKFFLAKLKTMNAGTPDTRIMIFNATTGLVKDSITVTAEDCSPESVISASGKWFPTN
jgi:outer membrane protein assembly factor BamB